MNAHEVGRLFGVVLVLLAIYAIFKSRSTILTREIHFPGRTSPRSTRAPRVPVSPERKQLRILIGMAVWAVVALFLALDISSDRYGNFRLGSFVAAAFAFSSPALLFGGIWLWWLRRK